MREIKFRAWDTYNKKMIPEKGGFYLGSVNSEMMGGEDYPIMQYTGLKDKNGKEIYEGDVVKTHHREMELIYGIDFDSGCFVLYSLKDGDYIDNLNDWIDDVEVIGNIHENPELKEKYGGKHA